jgi:hypothetical protein
MGSISDRQLNLFIADTFIFALGGLIYGAVSIGIIWRRMMNGELERAWKETVVTCLEGLRKATTPPHFLGRDQEPSTSRIQVCSVTTLLTLLVITTLRERPKIQIN